MTPYRELSAVLRVIVPLLGSVIDYDKRQGTFHRSPDGDVILLPGWWRQTVDYGSKAVGRGISRAREIRFDAVVKAEITSHRRYTNDESYIDHEAITGPMVVRFSVPASFDVETIKQILDQGGRYVGLAPFRWHQNYGRFEVVDVS